MSENMLYFKIIEKNVLVNTTRLEPSSAWDLFPKFLAHLVILDGLLERGGVMFGDQTGLDRLKNNS